MSNVINKLINLWLCVIFYGFMIWWRKMYIIECFRFFFTQIRNHDVLIFNQENICKLLRSFCFPEKIRKMSLAMKNGLHWHLEKVDFSNVKDTYGTGCTNSDFQENLHKKLAIAIPNWYLFFAQKRTIVQVAFQKWKEPIVYRRFFGAKNLEVPAGTLSTGYEIGSCNCYGI